MIEFILVVLRGSSNLFVLSLFCCSLTCSFNFLDMRQTRNKVLFQERILQYSMLKTSVKYKPTAM